MIKVQYRITAYMLMTADVPQELIGLYPSVQEAVGAANEHNGGYVDHVREVYTNSRDEDEGIIPMYQNYSDNRKPFYYIYRMDVDYSPI